MLFRIFIQHQWKEYTRSSIWQHIAILEKGIIVKDLKTSVNTLKELQSYFSV